MGAVLSMVWGWWSGGEVGVMSFPEDGELGPLADEEDPTTTLNLRHRTAITRTWDLVKPDLKNHGINFFIAMFRTEPQLQTRFKGFSNKSLEELKTNKRLAAHGTTVMMAITSLVDNLDDVSTLVELLKTTAANHKARGIPFHDFELLSPVLLGYLKTNLGTHWSATAEEGWTKALNVIKNVIFSVYDTPA